MSTPDYIEVKTQNSTYILNMVDNEMIRLHEGGNGLVRDGQWTMFIGIINLKVGEPMSIFYLLDGKPKVRHTSLVVSTKEVKDGHLF